MSTHKQFILMNAYDGELMIGNPNERECLSWVIVKEY
jgi:hypothetical protein